MEYIVIGSSGFIGSHLAHHLNAMGVNRQVIDLTDKSAVERLAPMIEGKSCFFCAGVQPKSGNIDLSENFAVLEPFLKVASKCEHVTYLSSDTVYPYNCLVTEDTPLVMDSVYARSHLEREEALRAEVGPKLLVARLSQVYGAKDTHNAYGPCRMIRQALAGEPITLKGYGEERRDHLYIDDLIKLLSHLSAVKHTGVVNVANGRSTTFSEIAHAVSALIPSDIENEPRTVAVTHRDFDVSRLTSVCHWHTPTSLKLENMIEELDG